MTLGEIEQRLMIRLDEIIHVARRALPAQAVSMREARLRLALAQIERLAVEAIEEAQRDGETR